MRYENILRLRGVCCVGTLLESMRRSLFLSRGQEWLGMGLVRSFGGSEGRQTDGCTDGTAIETNSTLP